MLEHGRPVLLPAVKVVCHAREVREPDLGRRERVDWGAGDGVALERRGPARVGRQTLGFGEMAGSVQRGRRVGLAGTAALETSMDYSIALVSNAESLISKKKKTHCR